jgi:hypothetical protein
MQPRLLVFFGGPESALQRPGKGKAAENYNRVVQKLKFLNNNR